MIKKDEHEQSAVSIVDTLLKEAIAVRASDIHLEQTRDTMRVRFRIDGILQDQSPILFHQAQQVIGRLKVLARLNITHKRIPQDGKLSIDNNGVAIDVRVSTFPSYYGEKMVIRILDSSARVATIDELGMSPTIARRFNAILAAPHGLFLVTGPTGSGKTTTLYSMLQVLNKPDRNIVTLEDPVEYTIEGVTQAPINPAAGFTFESGMRSVLRQDPDIIMVGEIRDKLTARTAIEAALTGHLVLSTLHTNDAPSAIIRLMDMGIEPYLIAAVLKGVLAQRLVRTLCSTCKKPEKIDIQSQELLQGWNQSLELQYKAYGCQNCLFLGYKGRTGIFELLLPSNELRSFISQSPNFIGLSQRAKADGMESLLENGLSKLAVGEISLEELVRVVAF